MKILEFIWTLILFAGEVYLIYLIIKKDVMKQPIPMGGKVITSVCIALLQIIGIIAYYFWARKRLTRWFGYEDTVQQVPTGLNSKESNPDNIDVKEVFNDL